MAKLLYQADTAVKVRTLFCAPNNCCHLECYDSAPFCSQTVQVSHLEESQVPSA